MVGVMEVMVGGNDFVHLIRQKWRDCHDALIWTEKGTKNVFGKTFEMNEVLEGLRQDCLVAKWL